MLISKTNNYIYADVTDYETVKYNGRFYTPADAVIVEDDSELAAKATAYFPDFQVVMDDQNRMVDIVKTQHIPTPQELRTAYEELTLKNIRIKYSATDENKVVREALASGDYTEFDLYNNYVEESKAQAHLEIYGTTGE